MENTKDNAKTGQGAVPQLRLRTDLRGGASVESCMTNLESWENNYYKQYNHVNATKPTPCNNL
jgi:hypothetical protein